MNIERPTIGQLYAIAKKQYDPEVLGRASVDALVENWHGKQSMAQKNLPGFRRSEQAALVAQFEQLIEAGDAYESVSDARVFEIFDKMRDPNRVLTLTQGLAYIWKREQSRKLKKTGRLLSCTTKSLEAAANSISVSRVEEYGGMLKTVGDYIGEKYGISLLK